jgi:hypothetical protein
VNRFTAFHYVIPGMEKRGRVVALLVLTAVLVCACGEQSPPWQENHPPEKPIIDESSGFPADSSTGVSCTPTLCWSCYDPDGDDLS